MPFAIGVESGLNPCAYADNHPLRFADPLGLTSNKRGPGLCNGTDCVEPPFDPSSKDQKPSPHRSQRKKKSVGSTARINGVRCASWQDSPAEIHAQRPENLRTKVSASSQGCPQLSAASKQFGRVSQNYPTESPGRKIDWGAPVILAGRPS